MRPGDVAVAAGVSVGALVALSGAVVFGYQGLLRLQQGYCTPIELRQVGLLLPGNATIADPAFSWRGVQHIASWILDQPLSAVLMVIGSVTVMWGISLDD